jgi:DNA-binding MurR/RpiR family transcriptional regulator
MEGKYTPQDIAEKYGVRPSTITRIFTVIDGVGLD